MSLFQSTIAKEMIEKANRDREKRNLDILTISIITTQLSLFYNSQLKIGKSELYKDLLSKHGEPYLRSLIAAEEKEFEILIKNGEEVVGKRSGEIQDALEYLQQYGWANFEMITKFSKALTKQPDLVSNFINDINNI